MPPTGGMGSFGMILMPLVILALLFRDKGPVGQFLKAGAVSPATARKPQSLKITNPDLYDGAVRRGILVSTGDGRYWVDVVALRRSRRRIVTVTIGLMIFIAAVASYLTLR